MNAYFFSCISSVKIFKFFKCILCDKENCDSLLILGIGNDIRGDDGLGPYIINQLSILKKNILNKSNLNDNNQEIIKNELKNQDNEFEFFDNVNDINTGNTPLDEALDSYMDELNVDVNESLIERLDKTFLINGGSVPENFTGLIKKLDPSHIILIDASLMKKEAGEINIVNKDNIVDISISTHSMSLAYLIKYLQLEKEYNILFIGIEPLELNLKSWTCHLSCLIMLKSHQTCLSNCSSIRF